MEEDEEEIEPIQNNSSYNDYTENTVVHNPLPFNPYTVSEAPPPQKTPQNNKNIKSTKPIPSNTQPFPQDTQPMSHPTSFNPQNVPVKEERKYRESELNEDGDPPLLEGTFALKKILALILN